MKKLLKLNKLKQATALLMVLTLVIGLVNLSAFKVKADDKTPQQKLEALLEEIDALDASDYTEDSWESLKEQSDAIDRPVKPYDEETEEGMPDIIANIMINNIKELMDALVKLAPQDKLEKLLTEIDALDSSDYTEDSWEALMEQAEAIDRPVKPYDEKTEEGMPDVIANIMINNIKDLKDALVKTTPQEKLEKLLTEIDALNASDYTSESWEELKEQAEAIDRPVKPYDEKTGEGMPDYIATLMINNLKSLMDALVPATESVYVKLENKLKEAEALNADDYTSESWNKVKSIIDSIDRPVSADNITEKLANKMLSDLDEAISGLQKKEKETISLEDGVYIARPNVTGTLGNNTRQEIKIIVKDGKYKITLYTNQKDSWQFEGGLKSNKQYKYIDKTDYNYSLIEILKPEYNSEVSGPDDKYATKNFVDGYDLNNSTYDDSIKNKVSSDNNDMYFDSVYENLKECHSVTFETNSIDEEFYVHSLFGYNTYDYSGNATKREYRFFGTLKFDKDSFVKLADTDNLLDINGEYVNNNSNHSLFGDLKADVETVNGKVNVAYSIDLDRYVGLSKGYESAKILDYDDNLLDVSNGKLVLTYNNFDELIAGKDICLVGSRIDSSRGNVVTHVNYTLKPDIRYTPVVISNSSYGIKLYSTTKYISDNAQISVNLIHDSGKTDSKTDAWANAMSNLPKHNGEYYFNFEVTDNGNKVTDFGGDVLLEMSKLNSINDNAIRLFMNEWDDENSGFVFGWFNSNITTDDDKYSIIIDNRYINGNWFIYDEKLSDVNGANIADGTYEVPITTFNKSQPGQTSMSAKCLGEKAKLVVKNGIKRLELNFNPVDIGEQQGYLIQMWEQENNESWKELTYTSYYKNADGSYFTDELNAGTNNYYPKTAYMILPTDEPQFSTKFRVSAMDSIMAGNGDATRDAIFTIYYDQIVKISDETPDAPEEEIPNFKEADKSKLNELIASAEKITGDAYTDSSFNTLTSVLASAKTISANKKATQTEVDNVYNKLKSAIDGLVKKEQTGLDYKNLPDGVYSLNINMVKVDKKTASMSDGAVNHIIKLTVKDGKYYITVNFKGLSIGSDFGYLKELKYYLTGYTMDQYGNPMGTLADTVIEGYQKNTDGTLVSDRYGTDYPNALTFEMIPEALEDGYVPLQVFVPIMEAIAEGNGDQNVFMKLDWTSIKATTDDDPDLKPQDPVEQSPAVDVTDAATGVKVHADKGVFEEGVQLVVTPITSGDVYNKTVNSLTEVGKKFRLYEVHFVNAQGQEVQPNGTVTVYYPIPEGYDINNLVLYRINEDGTKTLVKGVVEDGYYKVVTKSFSTYALVEKGSTITDSENTAMIAGSNVKTGDSNNFVLWIMLLGISLGAGAITVAGKRRKLRGE